MDTMRKKVICEKAKGAIRRLRGKGISERKIAKRLKITRATVRRWANREDTKNASTTPHKTRQKLPPQQQLAIIEIGRLLRWPITELRGHLKFFFPEIDKPAIFCDVFQKKKVDNKPEVGSYPKISEGAFYRVFSKAELKGCGKKNTWEPGTLAVHCLKLNWLSTEGSLEEGWALLLAERHSGSINILVHSHLTPRMTDRCIRLFCLKFETLSGHAVHVVRYVSTPEGYPEVSVAGSTGELEKERWKKHIQVPLEIEGKRVQRVIDPGTRGRGDTILVKGEYNNIEQVRDSVKGLLNKYNLRENCFSRLSKKPIQSPLEKIFDLQHPKKGGGKKKSTPLTKAALRREILQTGRNRGQKQK